MSKIFGSFTSLSSCSVSRVAHDCLAAFGIDVREVVAAVAALDVLAAVVLDVESGDDALDGVLTPGALSG